MNTLLAVDGSDNSYEAVRALKYLARADKLIVLHALDVPRPAYPMMVPEVAHELYTTMERSMREDGERLLDRMMSLLPMHAGPATRQLQVGSPAEVIVTTAEEQKVDVIVMGARGLGPVKERLVGSVSHRVLTQAHCAKLIVNGPLRALRQILLPLQGPYDADEAVRFLQTKPFHEPVDITILTVLPTTRPPWPVDSRTAEKLEEHALASAHDFVEDVATRLRTLGYQAKVLAALGTPASTIQREAEKIKPDLILMGSRGRQGIARFILGSVSHATLHQASCPLLVFH